MSAYVHILFKYASLLKIFRFRFEEVVDVDFNSKEGVQSHEMAVWERKNSPCKLPSDLKAFYSIFNGISCKWKVEIGGKKVQIGDMHVSALEALQRYPLDGHHVIMDTSSPNVGDLKNCTAFTIDSHGEYGHTLLLYKQLDLDSNNTRSSQESFPRKATYEDPEIWFADLSSRMHFITFTYTHYMRVMITHLGIFGWQMAYTPEGLQESTQHWMRLFCIERLCVDINWHTSKKSSRVEDRRRINDMEKLPKLK